MLQKAGAAPIHPPVALQTCAAMWNTLVQHLERNRNRSRQSVPVGAAPPAHSPTVHSTLVLLSVLFNASLKQVQEDRSAALARAKDQGFIDDYSGWRK